MEVVILNGEPPVGSDGSGYGDGYGDGDGYGYGYGYGDGSGYGNGYGDGSGYGYGDGNGDGSGSGYGYGYGYEQYWRSTIPWFASKWTEAQRARFDAVEKSGATIAFWLSGNDGQPSNGGNQIEVAAPGIIHTTLGPLQLCEAGTLHATLLPPRWQGDRWWIVALHGEVVGNPEKYGCLKREILGECL